MTSITAPPPTADVSWHALADGVTINAAAWTPQARQVLTDEAVALIASLHRALNADRKALLAARDERYAAYAAGDVPGYLPPDAHPEAHTDWQVEPLPSDCRPRRVEITGPVSDPKMVINMLSRTDDGHRADAAMLDFEDSMKPSWDNVMQGVLNVKAAAAGTLRHEKTDASGNVLKTYTLDPDDMPLLMVRIRGLHLDESNVRVDGEPVAGAIIDLALVAFHSAHTLIEQGKTPKYYVPKVEHYTEARWFNRLFVALQDALDIPTGTFKATFLIETLPAAFQMEEILYEFRAHAAGLNGGRWDKIFSDIKCLRTHDDRVLADRNSIGMNRPWMEAYVKHLIDVCHKHGAFGMGGMAPQTPGRTEALRQEQVAKVVEDKEFEASIGHDGCWVSHPYFIGPAMQPFNDVLEAKGSTHQLDVRPDIPERPDLLPKATGPKTLDGLRVNVRVSIGYMKGWNQDIGCVAWDHRMEDLATFEISRAQTWQWLHHGVTLDDGETVDRPLIKQVFDEEMATIEAEVRDAFADRSEAFIEQEVARYRQARHDAEHIFTEERFRPFLACASELFGHPDHKRWLIEQSSC
ncbi:malate synthase [Salisaeta longa]|uniref:malate synthase n=1 Tax=Salisaeta longa TaxID=503170 RepID=UPI0003B51F7A|nr:malate synthase [Salisaeta longa]